MIPDYLSFPHLAHQKVHLGVTGSIAAYKSLELLRDLIHASFKVSVTMTAAAQKFIRPLSFQALGADTVHTQLFSSQTEVYGHLQPGQEAQVMVIAPATANCLAKSAWGLADDILSCQVLSFAGPLLLAPAMNPNLWLAPATQHNVHTRRSRGVEIITPDSGSVACGDQGPGKLPGLEQIYFHVLRALTPARLKDKRVLITLGPTREHWDPVRFWSNPSSGKMGCALAIAAWMQGAEVHCVCGPHQQDLPLEIQQYPIQSAAEMQDICQKLWPEMDLGCLTAAVSDFRPRSFGTEKFKKAALQDEPLQIEFESNPDILQTLGQTKTPHQKLIGFAAETGVNLEQLALDKLHKKNLDLIVANRINHPQSGFNSQTNQVLILDKSQDMQELPVLSKGEVAWKIWDRIIRL